jgi:hypothetical protein
MYLDKMAEASGADALMLLKLKSPRFGKRYYRSGYDYDAMCEVPDECGSIPV